MSDAAKQWRSLDLILHDMEMIVNPGAFGLGSEVKSYTEDDKMAWVRLGELIDEAHRTLYEASTLLNSTTIVEGDETPKGWDKV